MAKKLLMPDAVRELLARRYRSRHREWLAGGGAWPLSISLGVPTEKNVVGDPGVVRGWVEAWSAWDGAAEVIWESRQWPRLGAQRVPTGLAVSSPEAVAAIVGESKRWSMATGRYRIMTERWPSLAQRSVLRSKFEMLANYSAEDFERLVSILDWLEHNLDSNLYLRQLPVPGLDTKWVERRIAVVADLFRAVRGGDDASGIHELCGLRKPPDRIRMRILCPDLRKAVGGLRDIEAPVEELAALAIAPAACLIVENLATGIAMPDMDGVVCIMKLGNAVSMLDVLPWLKDIRVVYWGDIDTDGFAILNRARQILPQLQSALMDEVTLLEHRSLWGREPKQCPDIDLPFLSSEEQQVYQGLRSARWGEQLRLEQERLPWATALAALRNALTRTEGFATSLIGIDVTKETP